MNRKVIAQLPAPLIKVCNKVFGGSASSVFKGMATLALGSGVARLIGIAAIPFLTRLYNPEDFGVLAVFSALILIVAPLLTFRYVLALPLPRHDGMAFNLLVLSVSLMLATSLLVTVLLWTFGEPLLGLFSMEVLAPWWWLIVLGLVATAIYEALSLWATRKRSYRVIASTNIWQSILGSITKALLGLLALKPLGLLIGQVVTQGSGSLKFISFFSEDFKVNYRYLRWSRLRKIAWHHRGFPIYRVPSQFLMVMSAQSPFLFSAALFGSHVTGQLSLALMALAMPVSLIGGSMGKALYAETASLGVNQSKKIYKMAKDVQIKLLLISIPAGLFLFILGERIFVLMFGSEWEQAGAFASMLSFYIIFQFTSAPLMQLLNLFGNQAIFLMINLVRFFSVFCVYFFVYLFNASSQVFVIMYSLLMAVFYIYISLFIMKTIKKDEHY